MPVKYCKPPAALYDYGAPSAKCPCCSGKLWERIWKDGQRVYVPRPHCSSFTVYQKATVRDELPRNAVVSVPSNETMSTEGEGVAQESTAEEG